MNVSEDRASLSRLRASGAAARLVAKMAVRQLVAGRWKTLVTGAIIASSAALLLIGLCLLDSVEREMSRSVAGSLAGHLQIYNANSPGQLEVMGGAAVDVANLEPLPDYSAISEKARSLPNIRAVVPLGFGAGALTFGNPLDRALAELRDQVRAGAGDPTRVRRMLGALAANAAPAHAAALAEATGPAFWARFVGAPFEVLEHLENRIAPLYEEPETVGLGYVGTDLDAYAAGFDRLRIVDGKSIPRGERGFLLAKSTYEETLKLPFAARLDRVRKLLTDRPLDDPEIAALLGDRAALAGEIREIVLQLDAAASARARTSLQRLLGGDVTDLGTLLERLVTSPKPFAERYQLFYAELAPLLSLYRIGIGETFTLKTVTRNGHLTSTNLRLWGTFSFAGLEGAPQASGFGLMDLVSFRDLGGFLSDERQAEAAALRAGVTSAAVAAEDVERMLFADAKALVAAPAKAAAAVKPAPPRAAPPGRYDPAQLTRGPVTSVAIVLHDPTQLEETRAALEASATGNPWRVIDWREASGMVGQFATLARLLLIVAFVIVFAVALVIISNALLMATLARVPELGTLRAIGAGRGFVLALMATEALLVGVGFGGAGAGLGASTVALLGQVGIPAMNEAFTFFFSGARLYPAVVGTSLLQAFAAVVSVTMLASLYPAWLATRASPRQAMAAEAT